MEPPFDPAIPLLDLYPKDLKQDPAISMFIAAPFTIAKLWNQPRCPSVGEWIGKHWCIHTMEHYSSLKENKIMAFAGKWVELENIMLSELSHSPKPKAKVFFDMRMLTHNGD